MKEAANIKLDEIIKNGIRMSDEFNDGTPMPKVEETTDNYPVTDSDVSDEPVNLDDIPF
jgi:hypothetical protein